MASGGIVRRTGWVADYCQICRDVQPHAVLIDEPARSGRSDPIVECCGCSLRARIPPVRYISVAPKKPDSVLQLMNRTFPRLPLAIEPRIRWEKNAIGGRLEPPERLEAIREPFLTIQDTPNDPTIFEVVRILALLLLLAILFTGIWRGVSGSSSPPTPLNMAMVCLSAGGAFALVWWQRRIHSRGSPLERLARSLRPLRPTAAELDSTLDWARGMNFGLGPRMTSRNILRAMSRRPDRSLTNADEMQMLRLAREMKERLTATDQEQTAEDHDPNLWRSS